jgi:hypothetical protein|tara:strand:- start:651 stop:806 length:156 start_codon:yes stop_codon:yes gene_type:complete
MNNISSVDIATITVFKKELENIVALNQRVSPIVIEYLTQRISDIESNIQRG